jgi:hypothetical protein
VPRARKQYDLAAVTRLVRGGASLAEVAEEMDATPGQIAWTYYEAEVEADPSLEIGQTPAAIEKARKSGLRWERIAVYSDLPISQVKTMWEDRTGIPASESYTGRGRRFPGMEGFEEADSTDGGVAATATTRRRRAAAAEVEEEAPPARTSRRRRAQAAAEEEEAPAPRARTRAQRQARAAAVEEEAPPTTTTRRRRRNPTS